MPVFLEKLKQIEKEFDQGKLELEQANLIMIGGMSILYDAFCGRLQGGFHVKSYYSCLGFQSENLEKIGLKSVVKKNIPDELNTKNIMKIDLLSMLDCIKT